MEVKIISEELIRPSSLTPQHLRTFKLSMFDLKNSPGYAPIILFYPKANFEPGLPSLDLPQKLDLLKRSLSQTLSCFYPLAGKILEDLSVECDDEGARFLEATVNMALTQILTDPVTDLFLNLFPCVFGSPMTRVTNVQVNVFECGGIAIALSISHILCDGTALGMFLTEWAAAAKLGGGSNAAAAAAPLPGLDLAGKIFPGDGLWVRDMVVNSVAAVAKSGKSVTKRLLFSGAAVEDLRAQAASPSNKNPSRVEAVTGLLWKCLMTAAARNRKDGQRWPSSFNHIVDIRRRMNPPLPKSSLGDLIWVATSHLESSESIDAGDMLPVLAGKLRGAISKVDSEFLSQAVYDQDLLTSSIKDMCGLRPSSKGEMDIIFCSSWCKFGFYEADFGWGEPLWVSTASKTSSMVLNGIILIDAKFGGGIEAWVTLDEQEMALLEGDHDLLPFAAVNPSPLIVCDD